MCLSFFFLTTCKFKTDCKTLYSATQRISNLIQVHCCFVIYEITILLSSSITTSFQWINLIRLIRLKIVFIWILSKDLYLSMFNSFKLRRFKYMSILISGRRQSNIAINRPAHWAHILYAVFTRSGSLRRFDWSNADAFLTS